MQFNHFLTKLMISESLLNEKSMTPEMMNKREEIVKALKEKTPYLKKQYGDNWESVMYAIATKQAIGQ